jgi:hypothetical protein
MHYVDFLAKLLESSGFVCILVQDEESGDTFEAMADKPHNNSSYTKSCVIVGQ